MPSCRHISCVAERNWILRRRGSESRGEENQTRRFKDMIQWHSGLESFGGKRETTPGNGVLSNVLLEVAIFALKPGWKGPGKPIWRLQSLLCLPTNEDRILCNGSAPALVVSEYILPAASHLRLMVLSFSLKVAEDKASPELGSWQSISYM